MGARRQAAVTTITVRLELFSNTVPGRRRLSPSFGQPQYLQLGRLVELHRFFPFIGNGERLSNYLVPNLKLMFANTILKI